MAKRIKYPLEMDNGVMVRTIEELRENFNIEKVLLYYVNGKLLTWLKDRYYDEIAIRIESLNNEGERLVETLCKIFNVEYRLENEVSIDEIEEKNLRLNKVKNYTADENVIKNIDRVALDQEELSDLLDQDIDEIYLCGEKFSIPITKENITYIGVNNPMIVVNSKSLVDFETPKIKLKNVCFNDEYQKILESANEEKKESDNIYGNYKTSNTLDFLMSDMDREKSAKAFELICEELLKFTYDIDDNTREKVKIIKKANLNECFNNYINRIS